MERLSDPVGGPAARAPRKRNRRFHARRLAVPLLTAAIVLSVHPACAQTLQDLSGLSIEDLADIEITSVSKRAEPLGQAAASVFVITSDEIRRSGAVSLAEVLRLAPNLEVARVNSQDYTISARGMNSVNAANKLLVLIDGRSVYTPFFSSVFWDQQHVMLTDVDRIEVISGPGGTLWGANAMNGVVNVITKSATLTQAGIVDAKVGDFVQSGDARWGGKIGDSGSYRVYALAFGEGDTRLDGGSSAMDAYHGNQAGFRTDQTAFAGNLTLQGDAYENRVGTPSGRRNGGDALARWDKRFADASTFQVQAYYDQQDRKDVALSGGGSSDRVRTVDLQAEHSFKLGTIHQIVWGLGYRTWSDEFINTANIARLVPQSQTLNLANIFAQDTIALRDGLKLTLGAKYEHNTFSGSAIMPSARLGWQSSPKDFLWAAISRAVRPPSRVERDLMAPGIVDVSPDFQSEKLIAYEAGWRTQLTPRASTSISLYYNDYTDLRTTSPAPTTIFPVTFGNGLEGHTYGLDAWASWNLFPWWRLDPGVSLLRKDFHLKPGQADIAGTQTVLGHDPGHQAFLRSYMQLPHDVELYVGLRQIGGLEEVSVPSYFEADVRIGWHVSRNVEVSLAGMNLVHAYHAEANEPPLHEIPRSAYLGVRWTF